MGLSVIIFDTRNLSPEDSNEVHQYIENDAFMASLVFVNNRFVGIVGHYENDPLPYLERLPHKCPYKDVSEWDLLNIEYVFRAAFML
jgi:hypothetical protein